MALFPIYGMFEGDFVPQLVAVDTDNSIGEVANAVAVHSVGRRVKPQNGPFEAWIGGKVIPLARNFGEVMAESGLMPLDFVTVRYAS